MCLSVGSFVHLKVEKWDHLLSFQDILTKIGTHVTLDLSHRLAKIKLEFMFVCLLVGSFIIQKLEKNRIHLGMGLWGSLVS